MSTAKPRPTASSEKLKWQAKAALAEGDYTLAIELFSCALEQVPKYAPYLTNRALCYYRLNHAEKVLKDAVASIQADPTWAKGYFYKARALEMLNRKKEAIECYEKCCELEPKTQEYQDLLERCRAETARTDRTGEETARHATMCDVCLCCPIIGVRYKCAECDDYDLCSQCVNRNPNQKGHRDTHPLVPIKRPPADRPAPVAQERRTSSSSISQKIDVSLQVHSYNVVLVVDISLSMIGYEANNRINPSKNRWPATQRGIIKIAHQLGLQDRFTCLAFNAVVHEVMDGESANAAKLKLALLLPALKPSLSDNNPGTALYDAIDSTFQVLLRNKLAGLLTGSSNRNQIILITDGEDCSSTKSNLQQACRQIKEICDDLKTEVLLIGIELEAKGRHSMNQLKRAGGEKCKFVDLASLSELDDVFDRISLVFTQRRAVINV